MPTTLKVQNFYYTNVTSESIPSSGAFTFNVAVAPTYTNGFLVISAENTIQREIVYFHSVSGNVISVRAENRALGGTTAKEHIQGESITMRDVAEIFNFYSDAVSTCFYTEKTGGLNVKVWGGLVYYNTVLTTVADTALTLTDNTTNYIKYDYTTNVISADTVNVGNIKAIVVTLSGAIVSIVYNTAKETYTDFTVSLNTALPSQPGNAGKFLQTDGTNATWDNIQSASSATSGTTEIPTTSEIQSNTSTGGTGSFLSLTPLQLGQYYSKGDGSDGSVTISSNTSLTRDMYYINLTVNTGITLNPNGYAIHVTGILTLAGTAKIARNGNNGNNGTGYVGGVGGIALNTGTCGPCLGGVNGGNGGEGGVPTPGNGVNGTSVALSYMTATGVSGGAGGNGGTGGTGGTSTQGGNYNIALNLAKALTYLLSPARGIALNSTYGGLPSNGGGGGGLYGGGGVSGGGGGGSGGQGGQVFIYANIITGSGTIESKGGTGGNGANGGVPNVTGGGGGGAGGNGGVVTLVYLSGTPYTVVVTGGTGGTGGLGNSGGGNGANGTAGVSGLSIVINN